MRGDTQADVVVVGGGFTGLWTALALRDREPDLDVVLIEADFCGSGPSGRNGGFLHGWWSSLGRLRAVFGDADAVALARASDRVIPGVRAFLDVRGEDAWLREAGMLMVSAAPAQDDAVRRAVEAAHNVGAPSEARAFSAKEAAAVCSSPVFREGVFFRDGATVHPGRLVRALRAAALDAGVRVFERSPATWIRSARRTSRSPGYSRDVGTFCEVETPGGRIRAGAAVVALNAWASGWRPVASRVTNMGSWVVLTEPAPDALDRIGWTGGEAICDARMFLHYFRTTNDGRVLMGAGAGRLGYRGRVDRGFFADELVEKRATAGLRRLLPDLNDVRVERSWGGPIDVSADRLPFFGTAPGTRIHFGLGYTGNGVGPSWIGGQVLASLATGRDDEWTRLPIAGRKPRQLPPEPLRRAGGVIVRAATLAVEDAYEAGRPAPKPLEAIAAIPRLLGLPLGTR